MRGLQLTLTLSLVLAIFVEAVLTRQGRAGQTKDNQSSGGSGGTKVGEMAPTFKLMSLDGKVATDLASFRDKRPVVLFFGSYT